jgi:hypothetical protein
MNTVIAWIMSLMVQVAPPERLAAVPQLPGWEETVEEKLERYESIAKDLYEVAYDPKTRPLYGGERGRAMTAATILGIAFHESGFAADVDKGPCYREGKFRERCDGGRSACLMQIQIGDGTTALRHGVEGLSQVDLFRDRKACFRAGLSLVRRSFASCAKAGSDAKLAAYASGRCDNPMGIVRSRELLGIARRFVADRSRIPGPDTTFLEAVSVLNPS